MGTVEAIAVGVSGRGKVHSATLSTRGETKIHGTRSGVVVVVVVVVTLRGSGDGVAGRVGRWRVRVFLLLLLWLPQGDR